MSRRTRPAEAHPNETRAPAEGERLQRIEQRLVADRATVRSGRLRIDKRVVQEPEKLEVELRHDEIDLKRRAADRPLGPNEQPIAIRGDETTLLVVEERIEVRKVSWVVEEIHLRRRVATETTRIEDTVDKQRWEISTEGDIDLEHRD